MKKNNLKVLAFLHHTHSMTYSPRLNEADSERSKLSTGGVGGCRLAAAKVLPYLGISCALEIFQAAVSKAIISWL
jgi:hypothetical protein